MVIANIISYAIHAYSTILLIYCICSWIPGSRGTGVVGSVYRFLGKIVDPVLNIFRKIIPPIGGTVDISPIVAMLVIEAAGQLLIRLIYGFLIF